MTTITILWILLKRTEDQVGFALKCWFVGAMLSIQCFKQLIGDLLWRGQFSWQGVLDLEILSLVPFGIGYLLLLAGGAMGSSGRPMSQDERDAYDREEAAYRAHLQEMASWKAINYFDRHRND